MTISVVIPVYNEVENLEICLAKVEEYLSSHDYDILFVNDGSDDGSLQLIKALSKSRTCVNYLSFSRNFGHQNALRAGFSYAKGDCVITMDSDLQHPPELLPTLIERWNEGYEVVQTKRQGNEKLGFFKRVTSIFFYMLLRNLSGMKIVSGTADFRLLDQKVIKAININQDPYLILRGLIPWMGFKTCYVPYEIGERHAGSSKYTNRKMFQLALDGVMGFSIKPLRISIIMGLAISSAALIYAVYAIAIYLFTDRAVSGWASIVISVLFIGGMQLISLGVIGEYIGKIFLSAKHRPNYIISEDSFGS